MKSIKEWNQSFYSKAYMYLYFLCIIISKKWHNISYYNTVALNLDASSFFKKSKRKEICINLC